MLGCAQVVNNVQRRFPVYWWSESSVGGARKPRRGSAEGGHLGNKERNEGERASVVPAVSGCVKCAMGGVGTVIIKERGGHSVFIDFGQLTNEDRAFLEVLKARIRSHG